MRGSGITPRIEHGFDGARMATGYAAHRPPIHERVMARAAGIAGWSSSRIRVLDVGCGAGLSTKAALRWARHAAGIDPSPKMVTMAAATVPGAGFAVGWGEALPVATDAVDAITAAGSLNFMDLDRFAVETSRVLHDDGVVVAYDFATGARSGSAPDLAMAYGAFATRWPRPSANRLALDPSVLSRGPFAVLAHESFVVTLELGLDAYVEYLMTETNVAAAIQRREVPVDIRAWCAAAFAPVFGAGVLASPLPIDFDAWVAVMRPAPSARNFS